MTDDSFRIMGAENAFINHGDGTFTCRRHQVALTVEVDSADPDMRIATCPVCNARAAALRGAILDAIDGEPDARFRRVLGRSRMSARVQAPCVYPGCDDGTEDHEPRLTRNTICMPCRRRYGKLLGWVLIDYVTMKDSLGAPIRRQSDGSKHQSPKAKSFGHQAEAESDWAAMIADQLNELEHDLREYLDDGAAVHPRVLEVHRVERAYAYLTRHFDALCTHPAAGDYAENLADLHGKTRSRLGQTRFAQHLKTPCPRCDIKALVRTLDRIDCENCGETIPEDHYRFWARILLDEMIDAYDKQEALV